MSRKSIIMGNYFSRMLMKMKSKNKAFNKVESMPVINKGKLIIFDILMLFLL